MHYNALTMATTGTTFLISTQNTDGGWGYAPGQASTVEATAAVTLSLSGSAAATYQRVIAWLHNTQHQDGGWGLGATDELSGWHTAWAVLTLARQDPNQAVVARGTEWLLSVETLRTDEDAIQMLEPVLAIDLHLRGWPWLPGEASWIEPTALAILALTAARTPATERIDEAARYLLDRRCQGGGWNVGNPVMFSQPLPARAHPTAWALLALTQVAAQSVTTEDGVTLRSEMLRDGGAPALAWGLLALRALGQGDDKAVQQLRDLQLSDGSWSHSPYQTALSMLALDPNFHL